VKTMEKNEEMEKNSRFHGVSGWCCGYDSLPYCVTACEKLVSIGSLIGIGIIIAK